MSSHTELFKNHRVWQLLKDLDPLINNAFNREGINPDTLEIISRIKSIFAFTNKQLTSADPYLTQMASLESLSVSLQNVTQEVNSFVSDGNPEHITNANVHADSVLSNLAQINVLTTTKDFSAAKEAAESYRYGIKKALSDVKSRSSQIDGELTSLKTQLSEISSGINAERERLSGIVTDFQSQFAATQESRNSEFAVNQKERQDNFTKIISDYTQKLEEQNTAFSAQRDEIAKLHKEELENLKKQFSSEVTAFSAQRDEIAKLHKEELENLKKQFVDNSTKLRDDMLERKKEVEKLVGVIGNLGVTSGYLKTANYAKYTVILWQIVTVCAMLGFIRIAYLAFLPVVQGEFTWSGFAGRVFVSITVGVLAAYAASQADKYQKIERHNRRLALELEAIGPFIAPLPQDKQEEFRLTIGDRSFGRGDDLPSGIDAKSPATALDILLENKKLVTLITEIIKATK